MAALLATRFLEKAPELLAYQASIVWAERSFLRTDTGSPTTGATDKRHLPFKTLTGQFQTSITTRHSLATPKSSPGAHSASRRTKRHKHAHVTPATRGLAATTMQRAILSTHRAHEPSPLSAASGTRASAAECCQRYNEGKCRQMTNACLYMHKCKCLECGGLHPHPYCPRSGQGSYTEPRSPTGPSGHMPVPPFAGRRY